MEAARLQRPSNGRTGGARRHGHARHSGQGGGGESRGPSGLSRRATKISQGRCLELTPSRHFVSRQQRLRGRLCLPSAARPWARGTSVFPLPFHSLFFLLSFVPSFSFHPLSLALLPLTSRRFLVVFPLQSPFPFPFASLFLALSDSLSFIFPHSPLPFFPFTFHLAFPLPLLFRAPLLPSSPFFLPLPLSFPFPFPFPPRSFLLPAHKDAGQGHVRRGSRRPVLGSCLPGVPLTKTRRGGTQMAKGAGRCSFIDKV